MAGVVVVAEGRSRPLLACASGHFTGRSLHSPAVAVYSDVLRFRELFLHLFRRDLQVRYRGSALGLLWTLINPLVLMAAYTLVFSILLKAESIEYFPLFVLVGLLPVGVLPARRCRRPPRRSSVTRTSSSRCASRASCSPFSVVGTNLVTLFAMLVVILPFTLVLLPETRTTFWASRCR